MAKPYVPTNEVQGALTSDFVHGTDNHLHLVSAADFDAGGGYIRVQTTDGAHWALYEYTAVSTNDLTGLTPCTLGVVETDAAYTFPAGAYVYRVCMGEDLNDLVSKTATAPAAGSISFPGIENGETVLTTKTIAASLTELGYCDGVTSAIQTQLDAKTEIETANRTIYVDADDGNDANDGTTSAHDHALATYSAALAKVKNVIANGVTITIQLAESTATYTPVATGRICEGTGKLVIRGELIEEHTGTAHASTATTLVDTGEFADHACVGWLVYSAAGGGQYRIIRTKNDDGVTATVGRWATTPNGDAYALYTWGAKMATGNWEFVQGTIQVYDLACAAEEGYQFYVSGNNVSLSIYRCSGTSNGAGGSFASVSGLGSFFMADTCVWNGASTSNYGFRGWAYACKLFLRRTWIYANVFATLVISGNGNTGSVENGCYLDGAATVVDLSRFSFADFYAPTVNGGADVSTICNGSTYGLYVAGGAGAIYTKATDYVVYSGNGTNIAKEDATYSWYKDAA